MGSLLGLIFSNDYMSHVENIVFKNVTKPEIYVRNIDDIFIIAQNLKEIKNFKSSFEQNFAFNFTYELS